MGKITWRMGNIDSDQLHWLATPYLKKEYGDYLIEMVDNS